MNGGLLLKGFNKYSSHDKPLISVITVVFNGYSFIEKAMLSVIGQTYDNVEYIIIDGGSTDGTLDLLKQHEDQIDYWESEKDNGIYDAMNRGVSIAHGEWVLFMGSDDYILNCNVLKDCIDTLNQSIRLSSFYPVLIYGDVIYSNGYYFKSTLKAATLLHNTVHHQAALYNKVLFDTFRYNISFKIVADYELNLLIYLNKYVVLYINKPFSYCSYGGASSDFKNRKQSIRELNRIRKTHVNYLVHICMCGVLMLKTFVRTNLLWK